MAKRTTGNLMNVAADVMRALNLNNTSTQENTRELKDNTKIVEDNTKAREKQKDKIKENNTYLKEAKDILNSCKELIKSVTELTNKQTEAFEKQATAIKKTATEQKKLNEEQKKNLQEYKKTKYSYSEGMTPYGLEDATLSKEVISGDKSIQTWSAGAIREIKAINQEITGIITNFSKIKTSLNEINKEAIDFKKIGVREQSEEWENLGRSLESTVFNLKKYIKAYEDFKKNGTEISIKDEKGNFYNEEQLLERINHLATVAEEKREQIKSIREEIKNTYYTFDELAEKLKETGVQIDNFSLASLTGEVTKLEDKMGRTVTIMSRAGENGFLEYSYKLSNNFKTLSDDTEKLYKNVTRLNKGINTLKQTSEVKTAQDLKKQIDEQYNSLKKLEIQISKISLSKSGSKQDEIRLTQETNKLTNEYKKQQDELRQLVDRYQEVNAQIRNQGGWMLNLKDSWIKAMRSFTTYMSVTTVFYQGIHAIKSMVNEVENLDKSLTEFKKVSDLAGESLDKYVKKAYELGDAVAKTGQEMIDAATSFRKSGYGDEMALELGKVANMYTNIADESISAASSADFIIAQLKAFNLETENATETLKNAYHVIDAVNEVANNFAVSSADIASNLGKSSAVMANAGNSLEQMIGLMTAGTEITRNASKVANGLKTITLRLQGMNDEGEKSLEVQSQMEALFNKMNISVYKSNGELKNTYEILETLAAVYPELTNAEKAYVTETIAGKFQAQNAAAILNNWKTAVEATTTALNSNGSAAKENARVLESIEGHLQRLRAQWQQLAINIVDSGLIKMVVDLGTAFLKLANSGIGQFVIKSAMGSAAINLLIVGYKGLTKEILKYAAAQKVSINLSEEDRRAKIADLASTMALKDGYATLAKTGLANITKFVGSMPGKITMVVAALYAIYKLIKWISEASERAYNKAKKEYEEAQSQLNDVNKKLEEIQNKIKEINSQSVLSIASKEELKNLQLQNEVLREQKVLYEEIEKEKSKKLESAADKLANEKAAYKGRTVTSTSTSNVPFTTSGANIDFVGSTNMPTFNVPQSSTGTQKTNINSFAEEIKYREELKKKINEITKAKETENACSIDSKEITDRERKELILYNDELKKSDEYIKKRQKAVYDAMQIDGISAEKYKELYEIYLEYEKELDPKNWAKLKLSYILNDDTASVQDFNKELQNLSKTGEINVENLNALLEKYPELKTVLDENGLSVADIIENYKNLEEVINQNATTLENLQARFKELQSSYDAVTSAVNEFNTTGALSAETLNTLMNSGYWEYLDWTGNKLAINNKLFKDQETLLKANMIAVVQKAYADDVLALSEGRLGDITAGAQRALADEKSQIDGLGNLAKAQTGGLFDLATAQAAVKAAEGKLDLDKYGKDLDKLNNYYNKLAKGIANTKLKLSSSSSGSSSSSSKSAWEVELENLNNQYKNSEITIEEYIIKLEALRNKYKKVADAVKQLDQTLREARLEKLEDDYKRGLITVEQYIEGLKELQKAYKEGTKEWNKYADSIKKGLETLLKDRSTNYKNAQSAAVSLLDKELDKLEDLKDETEKYYDDLIKAKEKANEETEKEIELAKLQEALENAKNNKTKRVYVQGLGWQWVADQQAIDEAQKALDDFTREQEIADLESQKEAAIQAIEDQIDNMKKYRDSWKEIVDGYEEEQNRLLLAQIMGANAENDILNQRLEVLEEFRDKYLAILRDLDMINNATADSISQDGVELSSGGSFANGGVVDYTGFAKVHGSASRPEVMLNNSQAAALYSMLNRPQFSALKFAGGGSTQVYNFDNLVLPNVTNARQFLNELKTITNIRKNQ